MAEAEQPERVVSVTGLGDIFGDIVLVADLVEHVENGFVGAAMRRAPERGDAGGDAGKRVRARRAGEPHRRGGGVLLVVGVQDEDLVHRAGEDRVHHIILGRYGKAHMQEVLGI